MRNNLRLALRLASALINKVIIIDVIDRGGGDTDQGIGSFYNVHNVICRKELSFMRTEVKLNIVKTIHTAIWLFFNVVIFYLGYAVISNKIDKWVWICLSLIILEGVVLLLFKKMCPVTLIARKYSTSARDNFDIFLPNWLAKHNKLIYTSIVILIVIILVYRLNT